MTEEKGFWTHTKEGTAKIWDKTKVMTEEAWDDAKRITEDVWKSTKKTGETVKHAISGDDHSHSAEKICAAENSDKSKKKAESDKMMPRRSNKHLQ